MKAVLISIQPKWGEKIANGEKTIEVRKSRPKLETPFKVYIYCTNSRSNIFYLEKEACNGKNAITGVGNRKVIGEFVCDGISEYRAEFTDLHHFDAMNENVCLNEIKKVGYYDEDDGDREYYYETSNAEENPDDCELLKGSCLTFNELRKYIGSTFYDKSFYGWHISQLKIYDKPKELRQFRTITNCGSIIAKDMLCNTCCICSDFCTKKPKRLTRPPQSWCYVEGLRK